MCKAVEAFFAEIKTKYFHLKINKRVYLYEYQILRVSTMARNFFNHDDSHPVQLTSADIILRQQLEHSIGKYFYNGCDRTIIDLLSACRWYVTTISGVLTLVVECPDQITNWQVLRKMVPMAKLLKQVVTSAKIRVCPPEGQGLPFEMRVDELGVYREYKEGA